ncbi:MAG: CYTH domain-containing protein [Patescibacteria group bacterium]|jgi:adenylate cyclase class IV
MAKREFVLPVDASSAREALRTVCNPVKRSQIDDSLFRGPDNITARLRRQDTVTRLSCTHPSALSDAPETVVLDYRACQRLLELLGFEAVDRVRFSRETWRQCQYLIHLDRTEALGDYLTVEAEVGSASHQNYRRQVLKFLRNMGILPLEPGSYPVDKPGLYGVDSSTDLPYTAPIVPGRSEQFEPQGT